MRGRRHRLTRSAGNAPLLAAAAAAVAFATGAAPAQAAPGDLDRAFAGDGVETTDFFGRDDYASDMALQEDGRTVVAGSSRASSGPSRSALAIARYNDDGALDSSFSRDGRVLVDFGGARSEYAVGVEVTSDDKIVVVGGLHPSSADAAPPPTIVTRLNPNGSLDRSFAGDGKAAIPLGRFAVVDFALADDGKLVLAGIAGADENTAAAVVRLRENAKPDRTFSGDGRVFTRFLRRPSSALAVEVAPDGRIVIGGAAGAVYTGEMNPDFAAARFKPDGSLDRGFDGDGHRVVNFERAPSDVHTLTLGPRGRIVLAGAVGGDAGVARLTGAGARDPSFSGDGRQEVEFDTGLEGANAVAIDSRGKIVIAGYRVVGGGPSATPYSAVARLNPGGSLDTSFSDDGRIADSHGPVTSILITRGDRVLTLGDFDSGASDFELVRLLGR